MSCRCPPQTCFPLAADTFFRSLHAGPQGIEEESSLEEVCDWRDGFGTWWHISDIAAAKVGKVVNHPRYHIPTPWAAASHHITIMSSSESYPISLFSCSLYFSFGRRCRQGLRKVGPALAERSGSGCSRLLLEWRECASHRTLRSSSLGATRSHDDADSRTKSLNQTHAESTELYNSMMFNAFWNDHVFWYVLSFRTVCVRFVPDAPAPSCTVNHCSMFVMFRFWGLRYFGRRRLCAGTGNCRFLGPGPCTTQSQQD